MAGTHKEHIAQAKSLLQAGAAAEAIQVAETVTVDDPDDKEAWSVLGAACFEVGDWERAETAGREVVRLEPGSARDWCNLGKVLRRRGQLSRASALQYRALVEDSDYGPAVDELTKLDELLVAQGKLGTTFRERAARLIHTGRHLGALALSRAQLNQNNHDREAWATALIAHIERRDWERAERVADAATKYIDSLPPSVSGLSGIPERYRTWADMPEAYNRPYQDARNAAASWAQLPLIPIFLEYWPSVDCMDASQSKFYHHWRQSWEEGRAMDVGRSVSYLFTFINERFSVLEPEGKLLEFRLELERLLDSYYHTKLTKYVPLWIADCHIVEGDLRAALYILERWQWTFGPTVRMNLFESLHHHLSAPPRAYQVLYPDSDVRLTDFGRKHVAAVRAQLEDILRETHRGDAPPLQQAVSVWDARAGAWQPFSGLPPTTRDWCEEASGFTAFYFAACDEYQSVMYDAIRKAENRVRQHFGVPDIGEGWVREAELCRIVTQLFPQHETVHHYRATWLGGQELDVAIPDIKLGIEYMGEQHYDAVELFGGDEALHECQRRDQVKRERAARAGWAIVEFRFDEELTPSAVQMKLRSFVAGS